MRSYFASIKNDHYASTCTTFLMSADTQAVESICEFSLFTTESNCEQIKTANGYILSTSDKVHITPNTERKSMFLNEILNVCEDICFIQKTDDYSIFYVMDVLISLKLQNLNSG